MDVIRPDAVSRRKGTRRHEPAAAAIGVFDSGLGGLTVLREIRRQMPGASVLYLADTANVPYGDKPHRSRA